MATTEVQQRRVSGEAPADRLVDPGDDRLGDDRLGDARLARLARAGQLAAGVAHDITNAISVIRLYADLLGTQDGLDAGAREHLRAISSEADKATSLAWQVLDAAHRAPPDLVEADLVACVDGFVAVARRLLTDRVSVRHDHGPDGVPVLVDPARFHQILVNLTGNARQAVGRAGEVVFTTDGVTVTPAGPAPVAGMIPGRWARLRVADSGVGIAPDVLPHVFEPFFSTKAPGRGTGLGLSQVRALISEHDGHVEIDSVVGGGTTVTLWLPEVRRPVASEYGPERPVHAGRGQRILLVEPDPDLRDALALVVSALGYAPLAVADGEAAVLVLEADAGVVGAGRVQAVVSAVAMAGLGGEGLARLTSARRPPVPVVLAGLRPQDGLAPAGPGVPAGTLRIRKPFSSGQLAAALHAVLGPS